MATTPFAISVHHFISSVGADVGFASIIGLAILVLLYFSQARETANLREQAYEANQRVSQLEARLTTMARQQQTPAAAQPPPAQEVAAQQAPAAHAGNQAASEAPRNPFSAPALVGATAVAPSPPAGVAAPALTAATKLIPTDPVIADPAAPHVPDPLELTSYSAPAPATAAGGSNGVTGDPLATTAPPRVTPPPARAAQQAQRGPRGTQPPRSRPGTQPPRGPERRRSRAGLRFGLLIGALAVAGVIIALVLISRGSGSSASSSSTRAASTAPPARKAKDNATVNPANVTVTVLNGTATAGLADRVATQLTGVGYKQGTVGNAPDQTRTATVVAYLPGQRSDALAVARSLKLGPSSVQPVDSSTRAVACAGSTTCSAQVVVTVGSDLAA